MKTVSELQFPGDRKYTPEHIWAKADGEDIVVGISDFAQDQLGEIAYVDLPGVGDSFDAGREFGSVESIKSVSQLFMPVNGEVTATNEELDSAPTIANVAPYDKGWMLRIRPQNTADLDGLLDAEAYKAQLG